MQENSQKSWKRSIKVIVCRNKQKLIHLRCSKYVRSCKRKVVQISVWGRFRLLNNILLQFIFVICFVYTENLCVFLLLQFTVLFRSEYKGNTNKINKNIYPYKHCEYKSSTTTSLYRIGEQSEAVRESKDFPHISKFFFLLLCVLKLQVAEEKINYHMRRRFSSCFLQSMWFFYKESLFAFVRLSSD